MSLAARRQHARDLFLAICGILLAVPIGVLLPIFWHEADLGVMLMLPFDLAEEADAPVWVAWALAAYMILLPLFGITLTFLSLLNLHRTRGRHHRPHAGEA